MSGNVRWLGKSEEELAVAETELLARVVEVYLTVLLTEESVMQVESELSALERQLDEANALYAKSLLPITQVLETQSRTDSLPCGRIQCARASRHRA